MGAVRFDLTPYSSMHLGHVWTGWNAWRVAHHYGAEFIVRFDDEGYERAYLWRQSWSLEHCEAQFREEFEWLGIAPDRYVRTTDWQDAQDEAAALLGIRRPEVSVEYHSTPLHVLGVNGLVAWSAAEWNPANLGCAYHPWAVVVQVVSDFGERVIEVVRGLDLLPQVYLYDFFWRRLYGGHPPRQDYLPLVWREGATAKESKSDNKGIGIRDLREAGYAPEEVIATVRECARRSAAKCWQQVVIPKGILECEGHGVLEYDELRAAREDLRLVQKGKPWEKDVRAAIAAKSKGA